MSVYGHNRDHRDDGSHIVLAPVAAVLATTVMLLRSWVGRRRR